MDVGFRSGCLIGLSQVVGAFLRDSLTFERGAHDAESMRSDNGELRRAVWYKSSVLLCVLVGVTCEQEPSVLLGK